MPDSGRLSSEAKALRAASSKRPRRAVGPMSEGLAARQVARLLPGLPFLLHQLVHHLIELRGRNQGSRAQVPRLQLLRTVI